MKPPVSPSHVVGLGSRRVQFLQVRTKGQAAPWVGRSGLRSLILRNEIVIGRAGRPSGARMPLRRAVDGPDNTRVVF